MSVASLSPSVSTLSPAGLGRRPSSLATRSTASVRTRYRRQTATLALGTTVVGLWLGLAAPSVSPVAPTASIATSMGAPGGTGLVPDLGQAASDQLGAGAHHADQGHHGDHGDHR